MVAQLRNVNDTRVDGSRIYRIGKDTAGKLYRFFKFFQFVVQYRNIRQDNGRQGIVVLAFRNVQCLFIRRNGLVQHERLPVDGPRQVVRFCHIGGIVERFKNRDSFLNVIPCRIQLVALPVSEGSFVIGNAFRNRYGMPFCRFE